MTRQWYWCLRHGRPETGDVCASAQRLGPYESREDAVRWRQRVESRNDRWEGDDRRWKGAGEP